LCEFCGLKKVVLGKERVKSSLRSTVNGQTSHLLAIRHPAITSGVAGRSSDLTLAIIATNIEWEYSLKFEDFVLYFLLLQ